jgi:integrase/recombinase XerD
VKPEWVKVKVKGKDTLVHFPEGYYECRYYEGSKVKYQNVGTDAADALAACQKHARLLIARDTAQDAGAKIVEETARKTLRKALDDFLQATEDKGSVVAHAEYKRTGEAFLAGVQKRFVDELVKDDMLRFYRAMRADGASDRTIHNRHQHVAAFLRYAGVPAALIPPAPKFEKKLPEVYSKREIEKFFASLTEPRDVIIYRMAQQLGLREQEIMHGEWPHIDFERKVFRVRSNPKWGFATKDKEERDVTIPRELLDLLRKYRKTHKGTLLTGTASDKPDGHLLRRLKRLAHDAGLHCKTCSGCVEGNGCEHWYLHKFRSTYATTLLRNGVDPRTVMKLMGHSDLETVLQYLRPAEGDELRQMVNAVKW